jgi:hypothetical protein
MIDWFVLLTPLALLPIFLLFVFIGCPLLRGGLATEGPFRFYYPPNLGENSLVLTIEVSLEYQSDWFCPEEEGESTFWNVEPPPQTIVNLDQDGDTVNLGVVDLACRGWVECRCIFTGTASSQNPVFGSRVKNEDEMPPTFYLNRDENDIFTIA